MDPPSSMASWTCSTQVRAHLCEISCVRWVLSASPSQMLTSWAGLRDTHLAALADTIIAYPIVQQVLSMYITNPTASSCHGSRRLLQLAPLPLLHTYLRFD
jgi:hypothetical protein